MLNIHVALSPNQEEKLLRNKLDDYLKNLNCERHFFFQTGEWNVQNLLFWQEISTNYAPVHSTFKILRHQLEVILYLAAIIYKEG